MSRLHILSTAALVSLFSWSLAPRPAQACGGCFVPPSASTVVTGHRMVVSVSREQTVLWDQIQYQGEPSEFAWVLPVARGAKIETSTAAFFEVLEATTQRSVFAPPVNCGGGGSAFGCSASELQADGAGGAGGGGSPVDVLHAGTVGPYETVTLATDQPGALNQWLLSHNFNVDPASEPIINQYVAEGFDFIALRLQPGKGVNQMTPVRIVSKGASTAFPLRMVAIGTGAQVPIVLYVIGEGRYTTQNFPEADLQTSLLAWDYLTSESNYGTLRKQALEKNEGRSWLTTFAQRDAVFSDRFNGASFAQTESLASLYAKQLLSNGETDRLCRIQDPLTKGRVVNPCPEGEPFDSKKCGTVESGDIDVRTLRCDGGDDIARAVLGMVPSDVWITRLEANLPQQALDTDLILKAADSQGQVESAVFAQIAINPDEACARGVGASSILSLKGWAKPLASFPMGGFVGLVVVGMAAVFVVRRTRTVRSLKGAR